MSTACVLNINFLLQEECIERFKELCAIVKNKDVLSEQLKSITHCIPYVKVISYYAMKRSQNAKFLH